MLLRTDSTNGTIITLSIADGRVGPLPEKVRGNRGRGLQLEEEGGGSQEGTRSAGRWGIWRLFIAHLIII